VKRRPVPTGTQAPLRLQRFVADEWPLPPLKEHTTEWELEHWPVLGPLHAWRRARAEWSAVHGDLLGNPLERLQNERATRRALHSHPEREDA
jgi:hypothetical protein